jgi:cytochrome P450
MTSDPSALQHILQLSRYNVVRPAANIERNSNMLGKSSILTTEGRTHNRIRKNMLPAFGSPEAKSLTHVFQTKAAKVSTC